MIDFITSVFSIALFPFRSSTFLLSVPAMIFYVGALFGLIYRLVRRDFFVSH